MEFFRNREIKQTCLGFGLVSGIGIGAGFCLGPGYGLYGILLSLALFFVLLFFTQKRYLAIAELSHQLDLVLHENSLLQTGDDQEGELSILKSEIYKMTLRLREQAEGLERDKAYLGDSLADISHQLRTPLTSIRLLVPRIQRCELGAPERMELFHELDTLLVRIDWLIGSLLKISKLESGTVKFQKQWILAEELVKKAAEPLLIPMELRGQTLRGSLAPGSGYTGDFSWSVEAMGNLLKNCMEHTPDGGTIQVQAVETPLYTEFILEDNGPGFEPEDIPRLFERFYKGKSSAAGNVGIGLALSKMIAERQGGVIKAENRKGFEGARFVLRFYKGTI